MSLSTIRFTQQAGVARLTLNRPEWLNAFNDLMHAETASALEQAEAGGARVLLLTGAGRGFCAGQDLSERRRGPDDPPPDLGRSLELQWGPLVRRLAEFPAPVLCAVNGVAAGAGANLALACDLVVAKASARFIQSFAGVGLLPDAGGTWSLPRLAGQARALGLAFLGEPLGSERAAAWGLIWRSVPDESFEDEVEALVARLAAGATRALIAAKHAIRAAGSHTLSAQLDLERDLQRELGYSADYAEGVVAFLAKRPPVFSGV